MAFFHHKLGCHVDVTLAPNCPERSLSLLRAYREKAQHYNASPHGGWDWRGLPVVVCIQSRAQRKSPLAAYT
jgi:hypothetical protein